MRSTSRLHANRIGQHFIQSQLHQPRRNIIKPWHPIGPSVDEVSPEVFRDYEKDDMPILFKHSPDASSGGSRVLQKWFITDKDHGANATPYLKRFEKTLVTYEWTLNRAVRHLIASLTPGDLRTTISQHVADEAAANQGSSFIRFQGPLGLFLEALDYNSGQASSADKLTGLYIAQSSIGDLPTSLQDDIAPPPLVDANGIYSSSIWMGITPTYTPLHRDPNPNLFRQLYGSKIVRLIPQRSGHGVFAAVQACIDGEANSRLRGEDMMSGPERDALYDAVWTGAGNPRAGERTFYEARLDAGDALYLPTGWWHSFKSVDTDSDMPLAGHGELNCSVNWWFRSSGISRRGHR